MVHCYTYVVAMGLVRTTSWYSHFNGSHFGLPPSKIHRMTGAGGKKVSTMTYSHRPHFPGDIIIVSGKILLARHYITIVLTRDSYTKHGSACCLLFVRFVRCVREREREKDGGDIIIVC